MKTTINKIAMAILVAMMTSANLMAFEDSLKVNNGNSIDLIIDDANTNTSVKFKDDNNNILFEQTLDGSEKFAKSFNLELLADGNYSIVIDDESKTKIFPLNISNDLVSLKNSSVDEVFKPVVNQKGSKVYVSQFSPNSKPLFVAIYNNKNEIIHQELLQGEMNLGKIFDFSNTFNGQYRINLKSEGVSYDRLVYVEK